MLRPLMKLKPALLSFVTGDPHFYGFEGESFDFMGEPNRYYNLLSDTQVQVNAYFVHFPTSGADNFTATDQLGILVHGHRIGISPTAMAIDGCEQHGGERFRVGGSTASVERFDRLDDRVPARMRTLLGFGDLIRGYHIETRYGYEFVVTVSTDNVNPPFLNLLSRMNGRLWPHGIIGQTADHDGKARTPHGHQGEGIIAGTYRDYEVSSLWASDFKYNKYRSAERSHPMFERLRDRFSRLTAAATRKLVAKASAS